MFGTETFDSVKVVYKYEDIVDLGTQCLVTQTGQYIIKNECHFQSMVISK